MRGLVLGGIGLSALFALGYALVFVGVAPLPLVGSGVKTMVVALLAVAGGLGRAPRLIVLGLALGALGDFWLSRPGEAAFLAGMGAFAAGHLAYAAGFGLRRVPLWALLGLGLLAGSTELWLAPHTGALLWPVRAYVGVICIMAALAVAHPSRLLWAGAASFVASDLMLAVAMFRAGPELALGLSYALWPAYWLGQALILAAFLRR